jgi:DNA-binding protein H-NS
MENSNIKAPIHIDGAEHLDVIKGVPKEGLHYGEMGECDYNIDYSTWPNQGYKKIPRTSSMAIFTVNTNILNPELMCDAIDSCKIDTDSMINLKEKIELAIKKNIAKEAREKKKIILGLAEKYNISLEELAKQQGKAASKKNKVEPKYRSPNGIDTWTGRGKKPLWVRQYLETGRYINDLTV